jgi:hypothetical protein
MVKDLPPGSHVIDVNLYVTGGEADLTNGTLTINVYGATPPP